MQTSALVWIPTTGRRIRVWMPYQDLKRPLCWFRVGHDGSVYTGVLMGAPNIAIFGRKTTAGPTVSVSYSEGSVLSGEDAPSSSRLSFKGFWRGAFGRPG